MSANNVGKYDREYLINKLVYMRIKGKSTKFILDFLMEDLEMAKSTAYLALKEAQQKISEMQEKSNEDAYNDAIARLEDLYETSSDLKVKLNIQQELNKLQGLYKPNKVDITSDGKGLNFDKITIEIIGGENE